MGDGAATEVVGVQISVHFDPRVRQLGQLVERHHRADAVVDDVSPQFPGQVRYVMGRTACFQRGDQVEQRPLALRSHDEIDDVGSQHRVTVLGREVTAPHDRHVRACRFDATADGNGLCELWSRHDGHSQQCELGSRNPRQSFDDVGGGIGDQVSIDEAPRLAPVEDSREGQQG